MYKHTQRSFAGGRLDRELMGRQDLEKYFAGASEIKNFNVRRQGNLSKRRGTDEAADISGLLGYVPGSPDVDIHLDSPRLFPLSFDRDKGYHILVANHRAFLCSRKGVRSVSYAWKKSIDPYDGTQDYAARYSIKTTSPAMIGGNYYDSLKEALIAAKDGDTITLGEDVVVGDVYVPEATTHETWAASDDTRFILYRAISITLDLAGHTITCPDGGAIRISVANQSGGSLTIMDSVGGGTIEAPTDSTLDLMFVGQTGTLNIAGGKIVGRTLNPANAIGFHGVIYCNGGTVNVTGGIIANEATPVANASKLAYFGFGKNGATLNVLGGLMRGAMNRTDAGGNPIPPYSGMVFAGARTGDATCFSSATVTIGESGANGRGGMICAEDIAQTRTAADVYADATGSPKFNIYGGALFGFGRKESKIAISRCSVCDPVIAQVKYEGVAKYIEVGSDTWIDGWAHNVNKVAGRTVNLWGSTYTAYDLYTASGGNYPAKSYKYSDVESYWAPGASDGGEDVPKSDNRPYYIDVPWDDADLPQLNYCQSGDTVFFAHGKYPPSKIEFFPSSQTLRYETLAFAAPWQPPVLTSVSAANMNKQQVTVSGTTTTTTTIDNSTGEKTVSAKQDDKTTTGRSTVPVRTVSYCVSYVKEGVESPPSAPVSVKYAAPWRDGDYIAISFTKGGNVSAADEYRIYKKQGTEYGLIGTVRNTNQAVVDPAVEIPDGTAFIERGSFNGTSLSKPTMEDVKARKADSFGEDWSVAREGANGEYELWPGVGGVEFASDKTAKFDFGTSTNISLSSVTVYVDSHSIEYAETAGGGLSVRDRVRYSGSHIACRVRYRASKTATTEATYSFGWTGLKELPADVAAELPTHYGELAFDCGEVAADAGRAAIESAVGRAPRSLTFKMPASSPNIPAGSVVYVEFYAKGADGNRCPLVLAGVSFALKSNIGSSFHDTYITPDMSLTPVNYDNPFAGSGNYPSCVGIHQQRLVFASTRSNPSGIWMSATGDLYGFAPHSSLREDDPIAFTLAATEFPDVNHLVVSRDIVLLADGGEWKVAPVSGNTLTFKTVSATLQSRIGSSRRTKPMMIGDEVVFADASEQALMATRYNYASDGYEATNLTILSSNLFDNNRIVQAAYAQHPDSRVYCILADGEIAAMAYMPEHQVMAWARHVFGGGVKAMGVSCSKAIVKTTSDTMYLVRKGDEWRLWTERLEIPDQTVEAQVSLDGCRVLSADDAVAEWQDGWLAVDLLTGAVHASFESLEAGRDYLCGFPFETELATVRPEPAGSGTIQFEIKNANDIEVRTCRSGAWRAAPIGYADHEIYSQRVDFVPEADGGALSLDTSDHALVLSGENSGDGRVQIKSDDPWPLNILSLSVNYEIQPLSGSEG